MEKNKISSGLSFITIDFRDFTNYVLQRKSCSLATKIMMKVGLSSYKIKTTE
jgi:hypothetical protein